MLLISMTNLYESICKDQNRSVLIIARFLHQARILFEHCDESLLVVPCLFTQCGELTCRWLTYHMRLQVKCVAPSTVKRGDFEHFF